MYSVSTKGKFFEKYLFLLQALHNTGCTIYEYMPAHEISVLIAMFSNKGRQGTLFLSG